MNTSHTPGPYYINGPHHLQAQGHEGDARPRIIAQFTPTPQRAADEAFVTRSMNAAPKLAEALRCIAVQIDSIAQTEVGVLWQHRETGRKAVEFTDEPRSVSAVEGWYPVGRLHLVPMIADIQETARAALAEWDAQ